MPRTVGDGLALAANGATVMALQSTYSADFQSYVNGNVALLSGMYAAAVVTRLVRSVGAEWAIRRLIGPGRRTLAAAARSAPAENRASFAGLMLDRLGLMAPRLASLAPGPRPAKPRPPRPISGSVSTSSICAAPERRSRRPRGAAVRKLLDGSPAPTARRSTSTDTDLLAAHRCRLGAVMAATRAQARRDALLGLVGIRRGAVPGCTALPAGRRTSRSPTRRRRRMIHEIDIYGVFVPDLLVWLVGRLPDQRAGAAPARARPVSIVWSGIARCSTLALFVILLGGVVAASQRFAS